MAQQESTNALSRTDSFQYPSAHDGHLNDLQEDTLQQFKNLCQDKGYFTPADGSGKPASHDNETLLRYLRARKFQPEAAFQQFKDTENWRKDNEIDKLYNTIDVAEYDETRRLYPQWTGRRDKRGIPVYVFEIKHLNSKTMKAYQQSLAARPRTTHTNISLNLRNLFALYENLIQFVMPLCSAISTRPYSDTPVSQSNNIVDISGVGLKQFWDLKGHMQEASTLATANYPETLDRIFIIGAPSFFPTVWSWIKRWFDPVTVSKIFILSAAEVKPTLEKYIDRDNIPTKYGGTLQWGWGDSPSIDDEVQSTIKWINPSKNSDGRNGFPVGPIRWRMTGNGNLEAVALGSVDSKQRELPVGQLPVHKGTAMQRTISKTHTLTMSSKGATDGSAGGAGTAAAGVVATDQAHQTTTGAHTHPADDVKTFPATGATPPLSPSSTEARSPAASVKSDLSNKMASLNVGLHSDATRIDPRAENHPDVQGSRDPAASVVNMKDKPHSADAASPREGTSGTRFEAQDGTHAAGTLAHGTPQVVANEAGDKTAVIEPRTIGQAPKDVAVPEAEPAPADTSYLGQAKAAAGGVVAGVGAVGGGLLGAVGLGGGSENGKSEEEKAAEAQKAEAEEKKAHQEVDGADTQHVEDFIRAKYASAAKGK